MVLIPPDVGIRMRLQSELAPLPVAPVKDLSLDLTSLRTGQAFTARILEVLPENTYRALVAGKDITLSLPGSAAAGDTLDLVVIDRTPKLILAQMASQVGLPTPNTANATLSSAAQLIATLLLPQGESPPAAALAGGQALLPQPPQNAGELASQLGKAVAQSGLFYESHQAQWVAGQLPLEQLRQEPQGQYPVTPQPNPAATATATPMAAEQLSKPPPGTPAAPLPTLPRGEMLANLAPPAQSPAPPAQSATNPLQTLYRAEQNAPGASSRTANHSGPENVPGPLPATTRAQEQALSRASLIATTVPPPPATDGAKLTPLQAIPDDLRPIVQQQLDAVATQRLAWHAEVWPGQKMDWTIQWEKPPRQGSASAVEANDAWSTTLSLTSPRLGRVDANLQLAAGGVRITLATPYGASAGDLRDASPALAAAMVAAGIPLLGVEIKHEEK